MEDRWCMVRLLFIFLFASTICFGQRPNRWAGFGTGNALAYGVVLNPFNFGATEKLSNGFLTCTDLSVGGGFTHLCSTPIPLNFDAIWEVRIDTVNVGQNIGIGLDFGVATAAVVITGGAEIGITCSGCTPALGWGFGSSSGTPFRVNNNTFDFTYGTAYNTQGTILTFTYKGSTTGELTVYVNGVSQGVMYTLNTATQFFPAFGNYNGNKCGFTVNFGATSFTYPQAGFSGIP